MRQNLVEQAVAKVHAAVVAFIFLVSRPLGKRYKIAACLIEKQREKLWKAAKGQDQRNLYVRKKIEVN